MRIIREPGKSGNVLATIAIGEDYLKPFMEYALHTWQMYAERHDLGIIVFDEDLIPRDHPKWKNPYWQKFLIPETLDRYVSSATRVACLDTDILINPFAPNIFDHVPAERIGAVSKRTGLPFDRMEALRRVAFLRNRYFDARYPLDSSLFASIDDTYRHVGLTPQRDDVNSGVVCLTLRYHSGLLRQLFETYSSDVMRTDSGGEQIYFNHFLFASGCEQILDYRFNALWTLEVAMRYPYLYTADLKDDELVRKCIESALSTNWFLHFAGSWHESQIWKQVKVLEDHEVLDRWQRFAEYLQQPVTGKFVGPVKPSS